MKITLQKNFKAWLIMKNTTRNREKPHRISEKADEPSDLSCYRWKLKSIKQRLLTDSTFSSNECMHSSLVSMKKRIVVKPQLEKTSTTNGSV